MGSSVKGKQIRNVLQNPIRHFIYGSLNETVFTEINVHHNGHWVCETVNHVTVRSKPPLHLMSLVSTAAMMCGSLLAWVPNMNHPSDYLWMSHKLAPHHWH